MGRGGILSKGRKAEEGEEENTLVLLEGGGTNRSQQKGFFLGVVGE